MSAITSSEGNPPKCYPCCWTLLLPMIPAAHHGDARAPGAEGRATPLVQLRRIARCRKVSEISNGDVGPTSWSTWSRRYLAAHGDSARCPADAGKHLHRRLVKDVDTEQGL